MNVLRTMMSIASVLAVVGFAQTVFAGSNQTTTRPIQIAMDDMKSMPGPSNQQGSGMGQMGRDRMMDGQMKPPATQGQDTSGQPMGGMMMMMDMMGKMMKGQMGGMGGGMPGSTAAPAVGDVTDRIEGRIAFLKAELAITDKQLADWNTLADALRSGRQHLVEARKLLVVDDKLGSAGRLERYERHLAERLEAIKTARAGFVRLYATLDSAQQRTADEIVLPLIAAF